MKAFKSPVLVGTETEIEKMNSGIRRLAASGRVLITPPELRYSGRKIIFNNGPQLWTMLVGNGEEIAELEHFGNRIRVKSTLHNIYNPALETILTFINFVKIPIKTRVSRNGPGKGYRPPFFGNISRSSRRRSGNAEDYDRLSRLSGLEFSATIPRKMRPCAAHVECSKSVPRSPNMDRREIWRRIRLRIDRLSKLSESPSKRGAVS